MSDLEETGLLDPRLTSTDRYSMAPYKSRFWAVYERTQIVAVVLYRKGAEEIVRRLSATPTPR